MGKTRDKQRTKGNLKPSSSGRAAALVTKDGSLGFVGFDGQGAANLGYVPMTTSASDEVDGTVDGSFRMVMRKLTKRDALTKYKALQEFSELCKSSKSEVVEGVLPFWPRLYNKLAMDTDQRVREATQEAMLQVVQRVGRNLAPYLKSVIGTWLCSQFDCYAPVASLAQRAFQTAFSTAKQIEALMFCKVGLYEYLEDNILRQTAETLSDPKIVSKEDSEAKYNRVVSSSLLALGYLMSVSIDDINSEMQSRYQEILEEKKLWKLTKHKSPLIRSAMFSLVISSCMKIPAVIQSIGSQVCPAVLSSLDESEPAVCQNLWGAVLFIFKTIPDCWIHVNIRKAVLPKLWSVLKHGGYGCATVIFPSLLPFLSNLPQEIIGTGIGFYQNFFDNLQEGLQELRVQHSPSESAVVMTTYMECLQYCLVHSACQENAWSVKGYLIKDQLLPLIKTSLQPDTKIPIIHLYPALSNLLNFLTDNISMETTVNSDKKDDVTKETYGVTIEMNTNKDFSKAITMEYKQEAMCNGKLVNEEAEVMLEWFWQGFSSMCLDVCTEDTEHKKKLDSVTADSLANCILGLKSPSSITKKQKKHKVAFSNPKPDTTAAAVIIDKAGPKKSVVKVDDLYDGQLLDIVCQVCHLCLKQVRNESSAYLNLLSKLFPPFISVKLLQVLLGKETDNAASFNNLCEDFINAVVTPLLKDLGEQKQDLLNALSVLFGVLSSYTEQEQIENLLNLVIEVNNSTGFKFALLQKGTETSLPAISGWLRSQSGSEKIQKLLRVARCNDSEMDQDAFWGIIQIVVANTQHGPLVNKSCLDFIMEYLIETLRKKDLKSLTQILEILCGYFEWCCKQPDDLTSSSEDILLALFLLQFSHPAVQKVLDVWETGLQAFNKQFTGCHVLLVRTSAIITEKLKTADSIDSILSISSSAFNLLHAASSLSTTEGTTYFNKIYHWLVPDVSKCTEWRQQASKGSWLGSSLCTSMPIISPTPDMIATQDVLDNHHKVVAFTALLTKTILSESSLADVISDSVLIRLFLETLWVNNWCLCVLRCRDSSSSKELSSHFIQVLPNINKLTELLSPVLQELFNVLKNRDLSHTLFSETLNMGKTEGWLWTVVLAGLIRELDQKDCGVELSPVLSILQSVMFDNETCSLKESVENPESVTQSIVAIIPYIDGIYDVKVLTEQIMKYISQDLTSQEFACVFPLIAASLTKWSELTHSCEEAQLEYQLTLIETLDNLMEWKNKHDRILLLNSSMNDVTAAELTVNTAVIKILELVIKETAKTLNSDHWDFILCGLAGWLQTCEENFSSISMSLLSNSLCQKTFKLLVVTSTFFQDLSEPNKKVSGTGEDVEANTEQAFPPNLLSEWQEFFSINVFTAALSMFLKSSTMSSSNNLNLSFWTTCESLGLAVTFIPIHIIKNFEFSRVPHGDDTLPLWAQDVLFHILPLLDCSVYSLQIAAFQLLAKVLPELASCEVCKPNVDEEERESERSPPLQLMDVINSSLSYLTDILDDAGVPFGSQLCLATDSEALTSCFTLFMSCKLLISFFHKTSVENRPEYATFLKKTKLINNLMGVLFRIMPLDSNIVVTEEFDLSVIDNVTERLVQDLGRGLYYSILHWMPAIVRQWFIGLEKKHATIVDKYTSSSVTPSLCQREMTQVKSSSLQFSNMQVKARPVAGEVAAVYSVDDLSMELVVKLANNHPLGVVTVDSGKKVGVTTSQWRSWILQMTTFLTHQNGSIMDGLVLWKQNADKHFEGVDDCMICFSVIHASNYSLPKLTCKTCKKKFHSICLYRWFNTSNNSTCPLCRNIF